MTDDAKLARALPMTRRFFIAAAPLGLAGCSATGGGPVIPAALSALSGPYGEIEDNGIVVPAVDTRELDPKFMRQTVDYRGKQPAGTIVIDTPNRLVYHVRSGGKATRYGCGVGKAGFEFKGGGFVGRTAVWPRWAPTKNMIALQPKRYGPVRGGMPGGIENPLGARALYIHREGRETNYRIHGTNEPWSIGQAVSSGCIRMFNHDIIDLHRNVRAGARIVVMQAGNVMSV